MVAVENRSQCEFIWQWRKVDCVPGYTFGNTKTSKIFLNKGFLFIWHTITASYIIPNLGRSSGGGNGKSLQYSCLENPMDRGAWQATVLGGSQRVGHDWACMHITAMSPHCPLVWRPPKLWFVLKLLVHHHPTFGKPLQDACTCRGFLVHAVA